MGCQFELKIDHKSLEHIFTQKDLNALQWHWSELFSEYNFRVSYIKGKENKVVDALSRRPMIHSILSLKVDLRDQIVRHLIEDHLYQQIKSSLQEGVPVSSKWEGYTLESDGLLWFWGRMYVPENENLRILIMEEAHRAPYVAHPGVKKMHVDLKNSFFWAG
jgi:hypothetical protein